MATFSLKVIDRNDSTICVSSGEDFVDLVCMRAYEEGDTGPVGTGLSWRPQTRTLM